MMGGFLISDPFSAAKPSYIYKGPNKKRLPVWKALLFEYADHLEMPQIMLPLEDIVFDTI